MRSACMMNIFNQIKIFLQIIFTGMKEEDLKELDMG